MSIKNRIEKLEKHTQPEKIGDVFTVRKINYRAGIVPGVEDAPDAIPLRLVEVKPREGEA